MALLDALGAFLVTEGVGTLGTNIFLGLMPDTPDECVVLYEYGGGAPGQVFGSDNATPWESSSVQVMARSATYAAARTKARAAYAALQKVANETLSGISFLRVDPVQSPFFVQRDENRRVYFSANYRVMADE
jgi:hypothetical protein